MNTGYLYFLLPALLWPLSIIINASISRRIWVKKMLIYRQITLMLVWMPLLFWLFFKTDLILSNGVYLVLSWFFWTICLLTAFWGMNQLTVWVARGFSSVWRTIISFLIWFFILHESFNLFDIAWIMIICIWFYLISHSKKSKLTKDNINGVVLSLISGLSVSINFYFFKIYSADFSWLESAYLLESMNWIFLIIITCIWNYKKISESFSIKLNDFLSLCLLSSPIVLLSWYWAAKSIDKIPFYVFNSLFAIVIVISAIMGRIFLKEKIPFMRKISLVVMVLWCTIIVLL